MRKTKSELLWKRILKEEEEGVLSYGWLPIGLEVHFLVELFNSYWQGKSKYNIEKAIALLTSIIISRYSVFKDNRNDKWSKGWTEVYSPIIHNWVGNNYTDYLQVLIDQNIIYTDNHYRIGEKSKAYKINPSLCESTDFKKHYRIPYSDVKLLVKAHQAKKFNKAKKKMEEGRGQLTLLTERLYQSIDLVAAENWFTELFQQGIDKIGNISLDEALFHLTRLSEREGVFNAKDEFGHRYHTPFTNLPSELRKFIIIDGEPACELDWKNSNAFYFGCIAKYPDAVKKIVSDRKAINRISSSYGKDVAYTEFIDKCLSGELYEHLCEKLQISRNEAKKLVMKVMNSSPEECKIFKNKFKNISSELVNICNELNKEHPTVPKLLQRLEAHIVVDTVAARLIDLTDSPFTTIHDSLLLSHKDIDIARQLIKDVHEGYGLPQPAIKEKGR